MEDEQFFAMALDGEKRQVKTVCSTIGHCLWSRIVADEHVDAVAKRLLAPDMFTRLGCAHGQQGERRLQPDELLQRRRLAVRLGDRRQRPQEARLRPGIEPDRTRSLRDGARVRAPAAARALLRLQPAVEPAAGVVPHGLLAARRGQRRALPRAAVDAGHLRAGRRERRLRPQPGAAEVGRRTGPAQPAHRPHDDGPRLPAQRQRRRASRCATSRGRGGSSSSSEGGAGAPRAAITRRAPGPGPHRGGTIALPAKPGRVRRRGRGEPHSGGGAAHGRAGGGAAGAGPARLTIAHISDLHAGSPYFVPSLMDRTVIELNELRPDLVLCTGDLTEMGFRQDYLTAKEYLERIECPQLVVIPGNHDARNVGYVHFEELFGPRSRSLRHEDVTIVAVDSSEPDLDVGQIGRARYDWLLDEFAAPARFRLFMLHHHLLPIPGHGARAQHRLRRRRRPRGARRSAASTWSCRATSTCPTRGASRASSSSTPARAARCACAARRGPATTSSRSTATASPWSASTRSTAARR